MASPLLRNSTPYVCTRCAIRAAKPLNVAGRRMISQKFLKRVAESAMTWQQRAVQIEAGKKKSMLTILEERGLVETVTGNRDAVDKRMTRTRLGVYVGIDPTAPSLHVGHLLPFMALFWMYVHGYHAVSLLGGATSKIGDPTDRLKTREKEHSSVRTANMVNMHYQLKKLWLNVDAYGRRYGFYDSKTPDMHREVVNNNAWWNKLPLLEVLQVLGHGMRLGPMLARETVKNKLTKGDGMSFAEFTYPIMQAWDWWYMYHTKGIHMQIGGEDQFGNITAGIDAIKYITKTIKDPATLGKIEGMGDPFGFTVPLLTTSSGEKFGKSAGNAIWLDNEQTSVFELYGYFLRTSDADVGKYLKLFTFMPIPDIDTLVEEHMQKPSERKAQHVLAREVVEIVHGEHESKVAAEQHRFLFGKKPEDPLVLEVPADSDAKAGYITLNNKPRVNVQLPASVVQKLSIGRILFACGLAESASEGARLTRESSIYIGGNMSGEKEPMKEGFIHWTKVKPWKTEDTQKFIIHGDLLMFRRGKHNIKVIQILPDEEYDLTGQTYPGRNAKREPLNNLERRSEKILESLHQRRGMDSREHMDDMEYALEKQRRALDEKFQKRDKSGEE
ncbi:hypothetical protein G7Y89_g3020 [Cudoniella acicularis]|uniref:Tyrosine--tRNA ligase n=1 Tax=Cudoniella acicularis TaxID=354080 RepID=A0A8H4RUA2_9HELO|nr:hypothetical protein G7Y89_g3020 [Cudoniella acicularis]